MTCKTGCHGVSRDALARIFEIIIVNCRHRSIRIGVTNGPETAGAPEEEPLSSPEPSTAMRGCEVIKLVGGSHGVIAVWGSRRGRQESGRIATSQTEAGSPTIRHAGPAQVPSHPLEQSSVVKRAHEAQREIDEEDASVASRIHSLTRLRPARKKEELRRWAMGNGKVSCLRVRARLRSGGGREKTSLSHRFRERAKDSPSRQSASEVNLILREADQRAGSF
jgi:hypothetical protein